jgi:SAM-dependent methyltransferase
MFWTVKLLIGLSLPYWKNPKIHNIGNGRLQSRLAPLATKIIDRVSYDGLDVRREIQDEYLKTNMTICDLCCGVGYSTARIGVDTSTEMIDVAKKLHRNKSFFVGNAENFGKESEFDVTTIMFAMHEIPRFARQTILKNAMRISKSQVIIVDISTEKVPNNIMLSGEPYMLEYQQNICWDIAKVVWETDSVVSYYLNDQFVKGHVLLAEINLNK